MDADAGHPIYKLGPTALKYWRWLTPILHENGLLTNLDPDTLAMYCDAWQQIVDADQVLERDGEFLTNDKGYIYQHPAAVKRNKAQERLVKYADRLGLSPVARRGLDLEEETDDELTDFLAAAKPDE